MRPWLIGDRVRTNMGLFAGHELQPGTAVAVDPDHELPAGTPLDGGPYVSDGVQLVTVELDMGDVLKVAGADLAPVQLGAVEIAEWLDVERSTVDQWRQRGVLPEPSGEVGGRPAWWATAIRDWAEATGRWPERPGKS